MWFTHNLAIDIIIKSDPIPFDPSSKQNNDITSKYNGTSNILIAFIMLI